MKQMSLKNFSKRVARAIRKEFGDGYKVKMGGTSCMGLPVEWYSASVTICPKKKRK